MKRKIRRRRGGRWLHDKISPSYSWCQKELGMISSFNKLEKKEGKEKEEEDKKKGEGSWL
jgi:hypothetical protein